MMHCNIEWALPRECEYCRSPLTGTDIVAVMGPHHVDFYCSACSKINHALKPRPKAPEVTRGGTGTGQ
jgi:hypothetical protein